MPEPSQRREAFRAAVTSYFKDAYREAGGRVDVGFADGAIEVAWDPQADQLPASATIARHLEAGRYDEAIPLLITRLQLEPDHVESLYNLGMVYSDRMRLKEARELLGRAVALDPRGCQCPGGAGDRRLAGQGPGGG
ncbi:tetratricopeptide repeat protein [Cyanobium sp. FGCU-6]|nr:tetratricopeptide repeat protein [Cyanobium sp. FGCU6]